MTLSDIVGVLEADGEHRAVRLEATYATDIDDLWSALTEPDRLIRWFAPVSGDLTLGGAFEIVFDADDATQRTDGTVLECREPEHLIVSWTFAGEQDSIVGVDLSSEDSHTRLVLQHSRLPSGQAAGYGAGWQTYLEQLAADLGGGAASGSGWYEREKELLPAYQAQLSGTVSAQGDPPIS